MSLNSTVIRLFTKISYDSAYHQNLLLLRMSPKLQEDALEERIMAELGGAGIAGQDVLEMVRVKEVLWRQEVRMAASCFAAVSCVCP